MDLMLNNLERLICHKNQPTNQPTHPPTNQPIDILSNVTMTEPCYTVFSLVYALLSMYISRNFKVHPGDI